MTNERNFYIDGAWIAPESDRILEVVDPRTGNGFTRIALGCEADVNKAVVAARRAFPTFAATSKQERVDLLKSVLIAYRAREEDLAQAMSREMGAPITAAREAQVTAGSAHLEATIEALEAYEFETLRGSTMIREEPIGVCGLITPWNWPMNQIVCKVAPAIAAGCTMVLKPSEIAPLSGIVFAEIMDAAGVPAGVFNLINGDGPGVGQALAAHPDVDMMSFTGSLRGGSAVAHTGADTVKRVTQELGGKSANILLPDVDFEKAVAEGVRACFDNTGQSCDAPTRMLVPKSRLDEVVSLARAEAGKIVTGDPRDEKTELGPLVSKTQADKVERLIRAGIDEGVDLVCGGPGRPDGLDVGYFVRPTIFAPVGEDKTIAREEIFGPVLSIMTYEDEEDAVRIANDSAYGLAAYVQAGDPEAGRRVARQMRAGAVYLNNPEPDMHAPFGGFKQSGNGREYSHWGMEDFLEIKGLIGYGAR